MRIRILKLKIEVTLFSFKYLTFNNLSYRKRTLIIYYFFYHGIKNISEVKLVIFWQNRSPTANNTLWKPRIVNKPKVSLNKAELSPPQTSYWLPKIHRLQIKQPQEVMYEIPQQNWWHRSVKEETSREDSGRPLETLLTIKASKN